jgi:hypothetical protein
MDPTRLPAVISLLPSGAGSSSMRGVRRISWRGQTTGVG